MVGVPRVSTERFTRNVGRNSVPNNAILPLKLADFFALFRVECFGYHWYFLFLNFGFLKIISSQGYNSSNHFKINVSFLCAVSSIM